MTYSYQNSTGTCTYYSASIKSLGFTAKANTGLVYYNRNCKSLFERFLDGEVWLTVFQVTTRSARTSRLQPSASAQGLQLHRPRLTRRRRHRPSMLRLLHTPLPLIQPRLIQRASPQSQSQSRQRHTPLPLLQPRHTPLLLTQPRLIQRARPQSQSRQRLRVLHLALLHRLQQRSKPRNLTVPQSKQARATPCRARLLTQLLLHRSPTARQARSRLRQRPALSSQAQ